MIKFLGQTLRLVVKSIGATQNSKVDITCVRGIRINKQTKQ